MIASLHEQLYTTQTSLDATRAEVESYSLNVDKSKMELLTKIVELEKQVASMSNVNSDTTNELGQVAVSLTRSELDYKEEQVYSRRLKKDLDAKKKETALMIGRIEELTEEIRYVRYVLSVINICMQMCHL